MIYNLLQPIIIQWQSITKWFTTIYYPITFHYKMIHNQLQPITMASLATSFHLQQLIHSITITSATIYIRFDNHLQ